MRSTNAFLTPNSRKEWTGWPKPLWTRTTSQYARKKEIDVGAREVAMSKISNKTEVGSQEPPLMDGNVFEYLMCLNQSWTVPSNCCDRWRAIRH